MNMLYILARSSLRRYTRLFHLSREGPDRCPVGVVRGIQSTTQQYWCAVRLTRREALEGALDWLADPNWHVAAHASGARARMRISPAKAPPQLPVLVPRGPRDQPLRHQAARSVEVRRVPRRRVSSNSARCRLSPCHSCCLRSLRGVA